MSRARSSIAPTVEPGGSQARSAPTLTTITAAWLVGSATGAGLVGGYFLVAALLMISLPVGATLHACGFRSRRTGAITGAVLVALAVGLWVVPDIPPTPGVGAQEAAAAALTIVAAAIGGAIVGWVVVRTAYGKATGP
ncbi:hypothetical protein DMC25_05250 [Caulobacter sp. D4A]|uniref:hypothetical protein n=1 Tax=unclassified Caulobacter TaxID=2648921 RepID=UPI000D73656E|nr:MULTISPECIES: hypothetical protein [unclassified Caulobacter]PXA92162.1 hypothetical protein DMC25_05250 [Caulobacter sp. D4A]PXA92592.1 hypothetical protein DMC18_10680 [Caulobacter sp. D5]